MVYTRLRANVEHISRGGGGGGLMPITNACVHPLNAIMYYTMWATLGPAFRYANSEQSCLCIYMHLDASCVVWVVLQIMLIKEGSSNDDQEREGKGGASTVY